MNKNLNKELQNSIKKRRLYIGGSMVLDPDFDIKKYLLDVQKQVELEKINFNKEKIFPTIKNNVNDIITEKKKTNFNTIDYSNINNINKKRNKHKIIKIKDNKTPLQTLNNKYIQSTKNKIEKIIKKNKEVTKSSHSIFQNKNIDMFITSKTGFNLIKKIKEIKKREKCPSQTNIIHRNNNNLKINCQNKEDYEDIYNNLRNIYNYKIAFDRKNENAVFEPIKILNDYKMQKQLNVNLQDNSLFNFNFKNKQLTKDSVLLKLMNLETNKLNKNYNFRSDKLLNNKKTIESNETNFEEYKEIQKNACKKLDTLFVDLQKKNKDLIEESLNCKSEIKLIEDDIKRILHQIDHLRVYGNFVNEVLGGDISRFEKPIFPDQIYDEELNIEDLSNTVIKRYKCFYDNAEQEKLSVENAFIHEPEKMWYKFKEMESIMVRDIFTKENLKGEIKIIKEENNINLKDLRQKNEKLESEYKSLNDKYFNETQKYNEIQKKYIYNKNEFDDLIIDFYIYIMDNFKNNTIIDIRKRYNKLESADCVKKMHKILCEKEVYIDKLMLNLKEWEKKDEIFFNEILDNRKKEIKHIKQLKILKKKMDDKLKIAKNMENGKFKIVFYSRKTEAPYHKPKKIVVEKVDEKLIEKIENEELLKYEDY